MKITEVHFNRKFNPGNYEIMDVGLVATVGEGDEPIDVLKRLDQYTLAYREKHKEVNK